MGVSFDSPDLRRLAFDLDAAAEVAPEESRKNVARGCFNIRTDARQRRSGSKSFPWLASAITYETGETPTGAWGEVGPDIERPQGNLGHIPEHGALRTPPEPYMAPAADTELPKFERAMEGLAVKAIEP